MSIPLIILGVALPWLLVVLLILAGCWIGFQLIDQNGRILARLEALEQMGLEAARPLGGDVAPQLALSESVAKQLLQRLEALEQRLPPAPRPSAGSSGGAGLALGSPAPEFELPDLEGRRRSLAEYRGQQLLLLFFNPGCGFCTRMATDLAALPIDGAGGHPRPLVVSTGGLQANQDLAREHGLRCPVLLQEGMEVGARYQANGTPMGYLIDGQGRIASALAVGGPAVLELAARTADGGGPAPVPANGRGAAALGGKRSVEESKLNRGGLAVGIPAPPFRLPLLFGGELGLEEYRGRRVLLVFSDPQCGPCDQLAPQLERHARQTPGVQVLMVSRGDLEANRQKAGQHGLTFPVVLQRQWELSRQYATFATPVGYLIDEAGSIVAEAATEVDAILELLSQARQPAVPSSGPDEPRCRCGKRAGECGCNGKRAMSAVGAQ